MKNLKKFNLFEEVSEIELPKIENEENGDDTHNRFGSYLVTKLKARFKNGYVDYFYDFDDENTNYEFHWKFLNIESLGYIQDFMKKEKLFKCSLVAIDDNIVLKIDVPEKYIENYDAAWLNKIMRTDYRLKKEDPTYIRPTEWRKEPPGKDWEMKAYRNRRKNK